MHVFPDRFVPCPDVADMEPVADAMLRNRFGSIAIERNAQGSRSDYLLDLSVHSEAVLLVQEFRERGIACGIRQEPGRILLRLSRDDVMAALDGMARHDGLNRDLPSGIRNTAGIADVVAA